VGEKFCDIGFEYGDNFWVGVESLDCLWERTLGACEVVAGPTKEGEFSTMEIILILSVRT